MTYLQRTVAVLLGEKTHVGNGEVGKFIRGSFAEYDRDHDGEISLDEYNVTIRFLFDAIGIIAKGLPR